MNRAARAAVPLAMLAVGGSLLLLRTDGTEAADEVLPALPRLDVRCSAASDARARRGHQAAAAAAAGIERYPFDAAEGLAALQLLREAERCFDLAGERSARAQAAARAAVLQARMQDDCRDHFLRYRVARASGRLEHALPDVEFLLALCAPERGPLATQLRRVQIEITERHPEEEPP